MCLAQLSFFIFFIVHIKSVQRHRQQSGKHLRLHLLSYIILFLLYQIYCQITQFFLLFSLFKHSRHLSYTKIIRFHWKDEQKSKV